ncbi:YbaK/EbsC family protein [Corynebacterium otitidis]
MVKEISVAAEDSDTASFIDAVGAKPNEVINSIVVKTKHSGERHYSLVLAPATHRLDNKGLRKALGGKTSFVPMDDAVELTGMQRHAIGPIGVPEDLPIVADLSVIEGEKFYVGAGVLERKYVLSREELVDLVDKDAPGIYGDEPA